MGLLDGKKAAIFGVANERSIAWAIAEAFHAEGAELAFTFAGEILEKRVRPLAEGRLSRLTVSRAALCRPSSSGTGRACRSCRSCMH